MHRRQQSLKHVTQNETLRLLDTLVQLAVLDRDSGRRPASPAEGQRWIVKAGGTGAWAGRDNDVAAWQDGGWQFSTPRTGWIAYVIDEGMLAAWNGTRVGRSLSTRLPCFRIWRCSVSAPRRTHQSVQRQAQQCVVGAKTVAEGGSGDLRYKLSKESDAKTLSFLFQNNYSARAEIGLTGDDDFHFKVSPDGSTFYESLTVDRASGKLKFPAGIADVNTGALVSTLSGAGRAGTMACRCVAAGDAAHFHHFRRERIDAYADDRRCRADIQQRHAECLDGSHLEYQQDARATGMGHVEYIVVAA